MKKLAVILLIIIGVGCKDSGQTALEYNTQLSVQNDRVVDAVSAFFAQMQNDDYIKAEQERQQLIKVCDSVIAEMQTIGSFKDDNTLATSLINYVKVQKQLAQEQYKQLLQANSTIDQINNTTGAPDIDAIAKAYESIDSIRDSIAYKDSVHFSQAAAAQKKFAIKHGFRIEEEEPHEVEEEMP